MQPSFRAKFQLALLALALSAPAAAQTRGFGRLVANDVEITEGCPGLTAAPTRRLTLGPGQPLPAPLPIVCNGVTLRVVRFKLSLPLRTEPGAVAAGPPRVNLDVPLTAAYDLAAEWSGGLPVAVTADVSVGGVAATGATTCADTLNANLTAQSSRVCEWSAFPGSAADGFSITSHFRYAPNGNTSGPVWQVRSTARYAWVAAPVIERVEFIQAVQTEDQRVPLVAGKPAQLRIFPTGATSEAVGVQVELKYGAGLGQLWRYTAPRNIITPKEVDRASDARSFLIPLPAEVVAAAGTIQLDASLMTAEGRFLSPLAKPVTIEIAEAPRAAPLGYLAICQSAADGTDRICPHALTGSAPVLGALAEQSFPVSTLPQTMLGSAVAPRGPDSLRRIARLRQWLEELQAGPAATVAFVLPAGGELAALVAGRAAAKAQLPMAFTSDDSAAGPLQLAQALAELYGAPPLAADTSAAVGFDLRSGAVVTPLTWPSTETLLSRLRTRPTQAAPLAGAVEFISLSGTLARDKSVGTLGHGFRTASTIPLPPSNPAALACLRLTAGSGETSLYCFDLDQLGEAATEDAFAVRLPWLAGTRQVSLLYDGVELASRSLSASPPRAELLTPQAGNRLPDGPFTVQWIGSDEDGDELRYDLLVSTDNGGSWLPVASEIEGTSFTLDTSMFPASTRVLLQLRYSDGLQSSAVTSGPFEISGPGARIQVPASVVLPPKPAGQTSEVIVPVENPGPGTLVLDSGTVSNPGVVRMISPASWPVRVAPGSTLPLRLRITPPSLGAFSATVALDGPLTSSRIQLSGRGVNARTAQLEIVPSATLDFGSIQRGQTRDLPVALGNGGGANLTITLGRAPAEFAIAPSISIEPAGAIVLPPGGQQQITLRFQPTIAGSAFGQLAIESDDPLRRLVQIGLAGQAELPVIVSNPKIEARPAPSADFGNVRVGTPTQQTFSVRNSGSAALVITRVSTSLADYTVRDFPALPFTLAPGSEQLFFVRLDPTATGPRLGQLQFDSNDPVTPVLRIGLSAVASLAVQGTVVLQLDDGSFERYAGFTSGDAYFLNRLKPSAYPATLKAIRVYFGERSLGPGEGFSLIWAPHSTGSEELPAGLRLQSTGATVRNPVEFAEYALPAPVTIESGDFLVGFQSNFPMAAPLDISTFVSPTRTYASRDGASWRNSVLWPGFPLGVFAVRAVVDVGAAAAKP